jgi:hypothetical protein
VRGLALSLGKLLAWLPAKARSREGIFLPQRRRDAEGSCCGWRVAGYSSRATSNPIRCTALGLLLCFLGAFVAPGAYAQLIIERTVNVGVAIPDRGQYVSTILWDHGGLTSISRVSVDLTLSSPSVTNPMWLGDMFASLTHGTASETERAATVFDYFGGDPENSATSLVGSYHFETQFAGSWLASNRWSLLLADRAQGGVGRLDSWKLTVEEKPRPTRFCGWRAG